MSLISEKNMVVRVNVVLLIVTDVSTTCAVVTFIESQSEL